MADIKIVRGSTFSEVTMWGKLPLVTRAVTAISKTYPPTITAVAHGLVSGWPVFFASIVGMVALNASKSPPTKTSEWHPVTLVDVDNITVDVNAADMSSYISGGYVVYPTPIDLSGYPTFRMAIKDKIGGNVLVTSATGDTWAAGTEYYEGQIVAPHANMTSIAGKMLVCATGGTTGAVDTITVPDIGVSQIMDGTVVWDVVRLGITLTTDNVAKTITQSILSADTAVRFAKNTAVYDIEAVATDGSVTKVDSGEVAIQTEVTT